MVPKVCKMVGKRMREEGIEREDGEESRENGEETVRSSSSPVPGA